MLVRGPSGSGKSTLLRLITGLIPRTEGGRIGGRVRLEGTPVHELPVHELPGRIGYVPQDPETAFVARTPRRELQGVLENTGTRGREAHLLLDEVAHELELTALLDREIAHLSGGEATRLALAAALAPRPDVLVLDEPTAQLDQAASHALARTLRALKAGGLSLVIAAHPPHPFDGLADARLDLGHARPVPSPPPLPAPEGGPPLLTLEGATHRYEGDGGAGPVTLQLHPGEVVALTGANGCGKTTLLHLAAGLLEPQAGRVHLQDDPPASLPARQLAARLGISFQHPAWHITQDTVDEEIGLTSHLLGRPASSEPAAAALGIADLLDEHPWDLSGGQRQRLAVATAATHRPPVLLLDEPTRGLDAASLERFAALLCKRSRSGLATLVATHHPWLQALAHRVVHLEHGRVGPSGDVPREVLA